MKTHTYVHPELGEIQSFEPRLPYSKVKSSGKIVKYVKKSTIYKSGMLLFMEILYIWHVNVLAFVIS